MYLYCIWKKWFESDITWYNLFLPEHKYIVEDDSLVVQRWALATIQQPRALRRCWSSSGIRPSTPSVGLCPLGLGSTKWMAKWMALSFLGIHWLSILAYTGHQFNRVFRENWALFIRPYENIVDIGKNLDTDQDKTPSRSQQTFVLSHSVTNRPSHPTNVALKKENTTY